jgi:hypothetical protein
VVGDAPAILSERSQFLSGHLLFGQTPLQFADGGGKAGLLALQPLDLAAHHVGGDALLSARERAQHLLLRPRALGHLAPRRLQVAGERGVWPFRAQLLLLACHGLGVAQRRADTLPDPCL